MGHVTSVPFAHTPPLPAGDARLDEHLERFAAAMLVEARRIADEILVRADGSDVGEKIVELDDILAQRRIAIAMIGCPL